MRLFPNIVLKHEGNMPFENDGLRGGVAVIRPFSRHSRTIYFVHAKRVATKKSPGAIFRERKRNPQGAYQGRYAQIIAFGNLLPACPLT